MTHENWLTAGIESTLSRSSFIIHPSSFTPMPTRLAAILALLAFAFCLVIGGLEAGNTFATTVSRALAAMAGTFVIGLVLGAMGQKMIDENLKPLAKEPSEPEKIKGKTPANGR
jgi:hypothetical protein